MKSKPIVMEHFSTVHTSFVFNFDFTNNITNLTGAVATGKTTSFFNYESVYGGESRYRLH